MHSLQQRRRRGCKVKEKKETILLHFFYISSVSTPLCDKLRRKSLCGRSADCAASCMHSPFFPFLVRKIQPVRVFLPLSFFLPLFFFLIRKKCQTKVVFCFLTFIYSTNGGFKPFFSSTCTFEKENQTGKGKTGSFQISWTHCDGSSIELGNTLVQRVDGSRRQEEKRSVVLHKNMRSLLINQSINQSINRNEWTPRTFSHLWPSAWHRKEFGGEPAVTEVAPLLILKNLL